VAVGKHLKSTLIEDVAEQTALQPWVEMEFFQIGRGRQVGRMESVDLNAQQIVREHQNVAVQKIGVTPANLCTISCCGMDPDFRFSELHAGDADAVFLLPGNTEFDVYVPAGARTSYISFDQDELLQHLRALDPERWEHPPDQLMAIPDVSRARLERVVGQFFEVSRQHDATNDEPKRSGLRRMLLQEILDIVAASEGGEPPQMERLRAFRICRSALGYVEDRLADDTLPTITDLCREFGVSERTLQYGFRSYVNMSPQAYLRLCRLNRVRAALSQPAACSATVTEVATRFGFFHMGKFAQSYRLQFGETPSKTLARGLGS
jgi:AraC family ethanolamine operon transcriptional activator